MLCSTTSCVQSVCATFFFTCLLCHEEGVARQGWLVVTRAVGVFSGWADKVRLIDVVADGMRFLPSKAGRICTISLFVLHWVAVGEMVEF